MSPGLLLAPLLALAAAQPAPALKEQVSRMVDLFYDLQFDDAAAAAQALAASHKGHPAGPLFAAIVGYQRFISEGAGSERALQAFWRDSAAAAAAAERLLPAAEGHYYLGAARGFRSRALAARGRYLRAVPEAVGAVRHLKEAVALDPGLEEAYLGLGMYHYFAKRLPLGARPFAALLTGDWGDRERGLRELERASEKGGPARMEAKSVLAAIYCSEREQLWDKAEELLAELSARYQRNPLYRLRRVYAAQRRGDWDLAVLAADPNGRWVGRLDASIRDAARAEARYRAAESLLLAGRPEQARPLLEALETDGVPVPLKDWALLRRANLLHALGREGEAEAVYLRLREKETARLARLFLGKPFELGPRAVKPFRALDTPA